MSDSSQRRILPIIICAALVCLVGIIYAQTRSFAFLNYDDRAYVVANPNVNHGLSGKSVAWAFTHRHAENWHPLTSLSHMLDCQVFGVTPGAPHVVNLLLHALAAVLLFLFLRRATDRYCPSGSDWPSAFVAAVFAVHPLHVESVAWIAERKDVLSGVFFMLTLLAYARYARQPSIQSYLLVLFVFAGGLMSKPMLVTVPVILLLLDYWPLGRIQSTEARGQRTDWKKLVIEKVPFFALAAALAVITIFVQKTAVSSLESLPLKWRLQNAIVSYVTYLVQFFWPANLAAFYPHPQDSLGWLTVGGCALFLIGLTASAWKLRWKAPWFITGWLWYLIMLLPVIGVLQVGLQAHADRYTYLPSIGLSLIVAWGAADLIARLRGTHVPLSAVATIVVAGLAFVAHTQASYWRNNETLWTHALAVTADNDVAHNNLGNVLLDRGDYDGAITHFSEALKIRSRSGESQFGTGAALSYNNLGIASMRKGDVAAGVDYCRKALQIWPEYADAHYNLGVALDAEGKEDDAIEEWNKTLSIQPNDPGAHGSLANAALRKGNVREAMAHYEAALRIDPDDATALNNLAWVWSTHPDATIRNGARAMEMASRAVRLVGGKDPAFLRTLAAAYAEAGDFDQALETAQQGLQFAQSAGNSAGVQALRDDLDHYRSHQPLRETSY